MKCEICGKDFGNLGMHIRVSHDVDPKSYYDTYMKQPNEGLCEVCGKPTGFKGLTKGYHNTCSRKCMAKSPTVRQKRAKTNMAKYGVANPFCIEEVQQHARAALYTKETLEKRWNTRKQRYKVDPLHTEQVKQLAAEKSRESRDTAVKTFHAKLDEFGLQHNCTQLKDLVEQYGQGWLTIKDKLKLIRLGNYTFVDNADITKIEEYVATYHGCVGASAKEKEVLEFIQSVYNGKIIENTKRIINPLELDIFIPDRNIAIEFNGTYWHSWPNKDKKYHIDKSKHCEALGIRLIHIYEWEWPSEKIKSLLKIALGCVDNKLYARQCEVKTISNSLAKPFNDANHLQGHRNAQVTCGLFYNDELVQLMSFSKTRYNRNLVGSNDWEIIRGCPGSNNIVVGGVEKLFKHFINDYAPAKVFSYCDFNKFNGASYEAIGMHCVGYTGPDMTWIINGQPVKRNPAKHAEYRKLAEGIMWGAGSKKYVWEESDAAIKQ